VVGHVEAIDDVVVGDTVERGEVHLQCQPGVVGVADDVVEDGDVDVMELVKWKLDAN